jgi:hypothetical protein
MTLLLLLLLLLLALPCTLVIVISLQVEALEAATRGGGGFNQPQYLHLQEALAAVVTSLDGLQVRHRLQQLVDFNLMFA